MKKHVAVLILGLLFLLSAASIFAEDDTSVQEFPFTGKAKVDNVNIRAGADKNFDVLSKLNSDDILSVVGKSYDWYKVVLPESAHCYVAKNYIEKDESGKYTCKVSNLNIRSKPNAGASILGQANKGDIVAVVADDADGWYEILPPEGAYGWVYSSLLEKVIIEQKSQVEPEEESKPEIKKKAPKRKKGFLWW